MKILIIAPKYSKNRNLKRLNILWVGVQQGLTKFMLTIEPLGRLMEKQAMRRMEYGAFTDEKIDKLGEEIMDLEL